MNAIISWSFTLLGVISIVLLVQSYRHALRAGQLTLAAGIAMAAVILPNLTTAVAAFTGERVESVDAFFNLIVQYGGMSQQVNNVAMPVLALVLAIALLIRLRVTKRVNVAPAIYAGILLLGGIFGLVQGYTPTGGQLTLFLLVLVAIVLPRDNSVVVGAGLALGGLASVSLIAAGIRPETALQACDDRKCGAFGSLFVGIADNQNSFGLLMALAVPVVFLGLDRFRTYFAVLVTLLALASGSRTSQVAALIVLVLCIWLGGRKGAISNLPRVVTIVVAGFSGLLMVVVPLLPLPATALTGRAELWRLAFDMIVSNSGNGFGPSVWRDLARYGTIPRAAGYATHNQAVEFIFVAGIFGGILALILFMVLVRENGGSVAQLALMITPVFICGIAERPWSLGTLDWMSWSILVTLIASFLPSDVSTPGKRSLRSAQNRSKSPRM